MPIVNAFVLGNLCEYRQSHTLLKKLDSLDYIFVADSIGLSSVTLTYGVSWPKAAEFGKITRRNGSHAVQGHSRSPILVPIESPYATSC